jgi:hypothetical protein
MYPVSPYGRWRIAAYGRRSGWAVCSTHPKASSYHLICNTFRLHYAQYHQTKMGRRGRDIRRERTCLPLRQSRLYKWLKKHDVEAGTAALMASYQDYVGALMGLAASSAYTFFDGNKIVLRRHDVHITPTDGGNEKYMR